MCRTSEEEGEHEDAAVLWQCPKALDANQGHAAIDVRKGG
jgi:hypothetical protein